MRLLLLGVATLLAFNLYRALLALRAARGDIDNLNQLCMRLLVEVKENKKSIKRLIDVNLKKCR